MVEAKGIHVVTQREVAVYGLNRIQFTTDAYLGLPTSDLGNDYVTLGYQNVDIVNGTEFGIVATANATTVTITPSVTTGPRAAGAPYSITLNQGETYQLRNTNSSPSDLSGSLISADHPIPVFGGHQCANIPQGSYYCDHVVEQLPPPDTWGRHFVTMPLATRTRGDTFRLLAAQDNNAVAINGTVVATLDRGKFYETVISGPAVIDPGRPKQNGYIGSFNGKSRDECLSQHWFISLEEAGSVSEARRIGYNERRPHRSLQHQTPAEFAAKASPKQPAELSIISAPLLGRRSLLGAGAGRGRPLLVNFWATWCVPCREEFPDLVEIRGQYGPDTLDFVLVSLDDPSDIGKAVPEFLAGARATAFPSYLLNADDSDAAINLVDPTWSGELPATFVYDRSGALVFKHRGRVKPAELRDALDEALEEKKPAEAGAQR